jgi:hypothetical protein
MPKTCSRASTPLSGAKDKTQSNAKRDETYLGVLVDDMITKGCVQAVPHVHQPGGSG